jgi:transcription antitermination factor NusG
MKKFIILHVGFQAHSKEVMEAWMKWFGDTKDHIVDSGNPFKPGTEVTKAGTKDLAHGKDSINGYTIIKADTMEDAIKIVQHCPMTTSKQIYEAIPM